MFVNTRWKPEHLDDSSARSIFYHDVPPDLAAEALARGGQRQSDTPGSQPWPLAAWPDIPTRFVLCRADRFFPAAWLRPIVRERLRIEPDEIDSGHCPALSRPLELARLLDGYLTEAG
jgi:pimeloyl-ACP methyl ester carboxylesterase